MQEIKSVEEMDRLPVGAVVIDVGGDAWQKRAYDDGPSWVMAGLLSDPETAETVFAYSPLLPAFVPDEDGAEADSLSQKMIDGINSDPFARRAFTKLADAYADGAL